MARIRNRLTDKEIRNQKRAGNWPDGGGLYLQVSVRRLEPEEEGGKARWSRTKSWVYRFTIAGRTREMGLGSLQDISLSDARKRAAEARKLVLDGIDPIEARRTQRREQAGVKTFAECAREYIEAQEAGWGNTKHAKQWTQTLEDDVFPKIGNQPVNLVDTAHVLSVLRPIWGTKTVTATRIRQRIELVLDSATSLGYREGANPARWKGHLKTLLPPPMKVTKKRHHPALPYTEVAAFLKSLRQQKGTAARALEFTILTAARTGEVVGATWGEIDLDEKLWVIPGTRMKAEKEHRVPLSDRAIEILRDQPAGEPDEPVFSARRKKDAMSHSSMRALLKRMDQSGVTTHGFRSSFRTWAAEQTNYPREIAEAALAHTLENKVEAAYRRTDLLEKRRKLMTAWAAFCDDTPATGGKVIGLRKRHG